MTRFPPRTSASFPEKGSERATGVPRACLALLAAAMLLLGCSKDDAKGLSAVPAPPASPVAMSAAPAGAMGKAAGLRMAEAPAGEPEQARRFLAVRHDLVAEVAADRLPDAWSRVRDLCGTLRCELLSSSLQRETAQQPGQASLDMRVLPADVGALLGGLDGVAQVVSHGTTSEDKTAEVVDVEAHIKNGIEFRDGLRALLADTKTRRDLGDVLAIQRTLSETQARLDSSATQRKLLEQQTGKQNVTINFTPARTLAGGTGYSPIRSALRNAGAMLAESVGALVTFVAVALPWLLLLVPMVWIVRALLRRRSRRRASASAA